MPLLDHLITELDSRLNSASSQHITQLMKLLPSAIIDPPASVGSDFENVLNMYDDDLPSRVSFPSELHLWQQKWLFMPDVAATLSAPGKHVDGDFFPNI